MAHTGVMWEPPYGHEGRPITADDPNPNTPQGQFEGEMRFVAGLGGSRRQRLAARHFVLGLVAIVGLFALAVLLSTLL
jgi:hypothetical protein